MSLKLVLFESLDAVSYSSSIVTVAVSVAVSEIFSVKECDLETRVRGRPRSFKMVRFDRPCTVMYDFLLVRHYSSILYHFRVI